MILIILISLLLDETKNKKTKEVKNAQIISDQKLVLYVFCTSSGNKFIFYYAII
jgi:hypothetical protein